jgi:hypothetical protein
VTVTLSEVSVLNHLLHSTHVLQTPVVKNINFDEAGTDALCDGLSAYGEPINHGIIREKLYSCSRSSSKPAPIEAYEDHGQKLRTVASRLSYFWSRSCLQQVFRKALTMILAVLLALTDDLGESVVDAL